MGQGFPTVPFYTPVVLSTPRGRVLGIPGAFSAMQLEHGAQKPVAMWDGVARAELGGWKPLVGTGMQPALPWLDPSSPVVGMDVSKCRSIGC